MEIRYDDFKVKAFLDANIILEGRSLADLPWHEIDEEGPIIALMTSTAMKEVDSKKQDGRIGKRAREFNRLIAPVAAGGAPLVIREDAPHVELALSRARRIPWDQHDDLDPNDGDSCIVAEAMHARDMNDDGKMIVSHDIKPIYLAANHNIRTLHVSDEWLRQAEPGPADKEVQRLKGRLAEYEAKEPKFQIFIGILDGEPVPIVRIEDLTDAERGHIERKILAENPDQTRTHSLVSGIGGYDHSYSRRHKAYRKRVPIFMKTYSQRLERLFNQARFKVGVANRGKMQAENLLVEVRVSSGWLHDRFVWVSPCGPTAPTPHTDNLFRFLPHLSHPVTQQRVPRHNFVFKEKPNWCGSFSVMCEDFRHGQEWTYEGIVGFDPLEPEATITVVVTASNFRGEVQEKKKIERKLDTVHFSKLIDMHSLKVTAPTPIDGLAQTLSDDVIDWKAFAVDDEDDE